jgi:rRNA pseudouridine-1189 N-methylase Emg1 (Nep1/Mra1 family)
MQILNSDDHANYLRKQGRNPADYRPDIIHQVMQISYHFNVPKLLTC